MNIPDLRLAGKKVFLRILNVSDATAEYCAWLNDPEVNKFLTTQQAIISELRGYIKEKLISENTLFLGIFWNENSRHIGNIKLEPIDEEKGEAIIGILVGDKDYWGKGVATEAIGLLSSYAFRVLKLRRLGLKVIAENKAAVRVYQKCGFRLKSVDYKSVNRGGQLYDDVGMEKFYESES